MFLVNDNGIVFSLSAVAAVDWLAIVVVRQTTIASIAAIALHLCMCISHKVLWF
jgi:hypothetical protein